MSSLPKITVLVIGYKRPDLLKQTVESLLQKTSYPRHRLELVLSDDGSPPDLQAQMRELPFDVFCFSSRNAGLGRNCNKGLLASSGDYILQLQDDWVCVGPGDFIEQALDVFNRRPNVGIVRFRPASKRLKGIAVKISGKRKVTVFANVPQEQNSLVSLYPYTDNPHIKRREFHEIVGYYKERVKMPLMELDFCRTVAAQQRFCVAHIEGHDVFEHIGGQASFNPVHKRERLKQSLLANPLTRIPFAMYLTVKHSLR